MDKKQSKPTFSQVVSSVLAAMLGVQNSKSYHRDFTTGNPIHYIIVGIIFVTIFVLILYGVVQLILANVPS